MLCPPAHPGNLKFQAFSAGRRLTNTTVRTAPSISNVIVSGSGTTTPSNRNARLPPFETTQSAPSDPRVPQSPSNRATELSCHTNREPRGGSSCTGSRSTIESHTLWFASNATGGITAANELTCAAAPGGLNPADRTGVTVNCWNGAEAIPELIAV